MTTLRAASNRRGDQHVDELVVQSWHRCPRFAPGFLLAVDPTSGKTRRGMDRDVLMHIAIEAVQVTCVACDEERLKDTDLEGFTVTS